MTDRLLLAFCVIAAGCWMYLVWEVTRSINYSLSYEDMVKETVRSVVKPECIVGGEDE